MNWLVEIQNAINFIEENILEDITIDDVAHSVHASKDYFNRLFMIVSGMTIKEYIRNRRLSLAGQELRACRSKVVDLAYKYAYETPESFSKAFLRFHGFSPAEAKDTERELRRFCPLKINIEVKGGFVMARKLIPNIEKLYENPADNYMFCSCMRSSMAALNGDKDFDFLFFPA